MFRPNSAIFRLEYSIWGLKNQPRGATDHQADTPCANTVSATTPIFVNEISSPPSHLRLDQTDNFPQMLYSNLKMAETCSW